MARIMEVSVNLKHVGRLLSLVVVTLLVLVTELCAVKITNLSVPRWIENGTAEEVILDCEYTISEKDSRLVLKWYLNEDPNPVHQWIPELKQSSTTNNLQGRFDGDNQGQWDSTIASARHRSLRIKNPTIEFTGKYRCDIVTMDNQDSADGVMIVYAPPKDLDFTVTDAGISNGVNLTCEAKGVFPIPQLRVYQITPGEPHRKHLPGKKTISQSKMGVCDIRIFVELDESDVPQQQPMYFECELLLQGTNYVTNSRAQFIPGGPVIENECDECGASSISAVSMAILLIFSAVFI